VPTIRRRWVLSFALLAGLIGATALVSVSVSEPARRYMEREINGRLTGYTITVGGLRVRPWTVSLELLDSTIAQDANPVPPVARIRSLTASLHWRALTHGKLVADITFDKPVLYVDLNHIRAAARSDVPLKDQGWQQALEAVALDLKINRLQVREGDLVYVDSGPFKPLRVSQLDLTAENIRNIRSKDRVYPSDLHLEGRVFDAGRLWLDGHADFLSEPHPGVQAALRLEEVELDYLKPITNRYNLSVARGTLSLAGDIEYAPDLARLILGRALVRGTRLEYVHSPDTALAEKARAARTVQAAKRATNQSSVELRIDRLDIARSTLGFANQAARPPYRVVISDIDLTLQNLSNQRAEGTAAMRLAGRFMGSGDTWLQATIAPRPGGADVDLSARIERTDMTRMNDLTRAYGGFDVAAGELSVYSELRVKNGAIMGYVKPVFRDVKVGAPMDGAQEPKTLGRRLYEGAMGAAAKVLRNRSRGEVATIVTISGRVDRPEFSTWEVVGRLLQNAFFKAILPGFDPEQSPTSPRPARAP
jgi:uncharacterized protein DUF748